MSFGGGSFDVVVAKGEFSGPPVALPVGLGSDPWRLSPFQSYLPRTLTPTSSAPHSPLPETA